ncbi:5-deoxy-glucuronate isomerase [Ktedonobacter racemifer]|uniref:Myo-inositol catabolism IolB domain protein n=1 Tax=Ktedonobacter racemifer DSM 44963 TaxID=485913 RepID=D6TSG1_KTERA|nr:5-deoxy-glucuronate isomerase [Ktedonobacter racemifer]EFH83362.1 Myo-inositol catabolism IolB domain protein [Ktedonobacter racemifer DSM 44963]
MRQYDASNLVVHPGNAHAANVIVEVTAEMAGWDYLHFQAHHLSVRDTWTFATGERELALVVLGGRIQVESNRGQWSHIGERESVFTGLPHALYLPRQTTLNVRAETECEYAVISAPADQDYTPRLITPHDIATEIRGGDNATRQINNIIPPGFSCQRLVVVEVYTPGGNWSSYPPHKHDIHKTDIYGQVVEADLEEVYFYKLSRPEGYAYQRIYTDPESPLHRAGFPIDTLLMARDNDAVLVPEGYHPVASPPGYTTYYLNALAGSAQSLANSEDPRYVWVKENYKGLDERIPLYEIKHRL